MYESIGKNLKSENGGVPELKQFEDNSLENQTKTFSEVDDIFPALQKYKNEHNADNLQKLLVQVSEFYRAIYASTKNEDERKVFKKMLDKLKDI